MKKKFFLAKNELKNIQNTSVSVALNQILNSNILSVVDPIGGNNYSQSYPSTYTQNYIQKYTRRIPIT